MGDDCATGVGFTRNPATGAREFYGEYLVNAQGEDVVAGIRTPTPDPRHEEGSPEGIRPVDADHREVGEALQGRAGFRVHHREQHLVHAPDAEREADRGRGRQDRRGHGEGEADHEGGCAPAPRAPADRPAASPGDRPEGEARRRRQRAPRLPRRRDRRGGLPRRKGGGVGHRGEGRDPGPQGDESRRYPRYGRGAGESSPRRGG